MNTQKKICLLLIFLSFVLLTGIAFAGRTSLRNASRRTIAYIYDNGRIISSSGRQLGFYQPSGRIVDAKGLTVGQVQNGRVSRFGRNLGRIKGRYFFNAGGKKIAELKSGRLRDASGRAIGYTDSIKLATVYMYFRDRIFRESRQPGQVHTPGTPLIPKK